MDNLPAKKPNIILPTNTPQFREFVREVTGASKPEIKVMKSGTRPHGWCSINAQSYIDENGGSIVKGWSFAFNREQKSYIAIYHYVVEDISGNLLCVTEDPELETIWFMVDDRFSILTEPLDDSYHSVRRPANRAAMRKEPKRLFYVEDSTGIAREGKQHSILECRVSNSSIDKNNSDLLE